MLSEQQCATLIIGLHAALPNGVKDDRERSELRQRIGFEITRLPQGKVKATIIVNLP